MINKIAQPANLYLAWAKLKKALKPGDMWFDQIELARFEANLESELGLIRKDILENTYKISPIRPVGFPKSKKDGVIKTRQSFLFTVRDQLTWVAILNIIGPELDILMPFWSFGHRLYRSVWYDDGTESKELKFGWYRHSTGNIYRKWSQSWPRYRRCVSVTTRVMAFNAIFKDNHERFIKEILSDEQEIQELKQNENLPDNLLIGYWKKEYWNAQLTGKVFWGSIDLEKFYPSIKLDAVFNSMQKYLPAEVWSDDLSAFIKSMLTFPINSDDWSSEELDLIDLKKDSNHFESIPTGLLVSGFLSNIAMLPVDNAISNKLKNTPTVAHFRFVDDHIVLSDSFEELIKWINEYEEMIGEFLPGAAINKSKSEPEGLRKYFSASDEDRDKCKSDAESETSLDPMFPSPLMTQTLAKVSLINSTEFDLLDDQEEDQMIADLEHLLLAELPEQELRKDTRVSFAATMLSRIVPKRINDVSKLYKFHVLDKRFLDAEQKYSMEIADVKNESPKFNEFTEALKEIGESRRALKLLIANEESSLESENLKVRKHVFKLLTKAVRENHSKVRLWIRLLEYCHNTGHKAIADSLDEVAKLEDHEASKLSCEFIYATALHVLSEQVLRTCVTLTDPNCSHFRREGAARYFSELVSEQLQSTINMIEAKASRFYLKKSIGLFRLSLTTGMFWITDYQFQVKTIPIDAAYLKSSEVYANDVIALSDQYGYRISDLFWWFVKITTPLQSTRPNRIWEKAVKLMPLDQNSSWAVLSMFPDRIPLEIANVLGNFKDHSSQYSSNAGWMFELKGAENSPPYQINGKQYLDLYQWCKWTREKNDENIKDSYGAFDPRLSEWTALKIVYEIADKLEVKDKPFYWFFNQGGYSNIHPSNYLLPLEWSTTPFYDWPKWKQKIRKGIEFKPEGDFINDFRYKPLGTDSFTINEEASLVSGLGTILMGLLCKNFKMPFIWNVHGQQMVSLYLATQRIKSVPISSLTYGIIESCFSLRNIDTILVRSTQSTIKQSPDFSDDTDFDPPMATTLKELKIRLKKSMLVLERYQISVQNNMPRQLIPINLLQYSRKGNSFFDADEGEPNEN
jgi:hypothetical protein